MLCILYSQNGTPQKNCIDKENNHPYIVRLFDGDREVLPTYDIVVVQEILTRCKNLSVALLVNLALHYIFNIAYQSHIHDNDAVSPGSCH